VTAVGFAGRVAPGAWLIPYATVPCVIGRFSGRASGVSRGRRCTAYECRPCVGSTPPRRAHQDSAQPVLWRGPHRFSSRVSVTSLVAVGKAGGQSSPVARCRPACLPCRARSALCCPAYWALARGLLYLAMGVISSERPQAGGKPPRLSLESRHPVVVACGRVVWYGWSVPTCRLVLPQPSLAMVLGSVTWSLGAATGSCAEQKSCRSRETGQIGLEIYAHGAGGLADHSQSGNRA
jgi:hypothetical protein